MGLYTVRIAKSFGGKTLTSPSTWSSRSCSSSREGNSPIVEKGLNPKRRKRRATKTKVMTKIIKEKMMMVKAKDALKSQFRSNRGKKTLL